MIKVFQKRWFAIEFDEFYQLNPKHMAGTEFYKRFYEVFYQTYPTWDSLPAAYHAIRKKVADHLASLIVEKKAQTVLSIGCGNGLVEKQLMHQLPHLQLFVYEPDETNLTWLKNLSDARLCFGEFPDCLPAGQHYDLVYLCDVDPIFSDQDYVSFLAKIREATPAPVVLTNVIKPLPDAWSSMKYWVKWGLAKLRLYQLGQLLGYSRYFHEHVAIFRQAGYHVVNKGDLSKGLMWIELNK